MLLIFLLTFVMVAGSSYPIWPPPQLVDASGDSVELDHNFTIETTHDSNRLLDSIKRYINIIRRIQSKSNKKESHILRSKSSSPVLRRLQIVVMTDDTYLGPNTQYDYRFQLLSGDSIINANATSIYGAIYAMESFIQLVRVGSGSAILMHSSVSVVDSPQYAWRGLMIDTGRRFFPMPLVKNLLDTMVSNKMNVLHLHASDLCRFGVESKKYPNLTKSLTGIHAGFYSQDDIKNMIVYAQDRGIRVVPEFDVPGHSRGFVPLESNGVQFCSTGGGRKQLYGDPAGKTYAVLHDLFQEMTALFQDEVFNIGCDETRVTGRCTQNSTFNLERKLFNAIANEFGKTPEGWEEAYFNAGAATNNTIVDTWDSHTASEITKTGRRAVESSYRHFYFTNPVVAGPAGWHRCWYNISTNVTKKDLHLLQGGEISIWTDTYCYTQQCDPTSLSKPVGYKLFDPKYDNEFGKSIGGMIWPRGYVAAAAFWNYNNSINPSSKEFVESLYRFNDDLISRGSWACPSKCKCDQLSACGNPYITPIVPKAGDILKLTSCNEGFTKWEWTTSGPIYVRGNKSLCINFFGSGTIYPLTIQPCTPLDTWMHNPNTSTIIHGSEPTVNLSPSTSRSDCLDLNTNDGVVGSYGCGSFPQPNQQWSYDPSVGSLVSMSHYDGNPNKSMYAGMCITTVPLA